MFQFLCFLFFICSLPLFESSMYVRVCPVSKDWTDFRDDFYCNSTSLNCTADKIRANGLYKGNVVLLHDNNWPLVSHLTNSFADCDIPVVVLNGNKWNMNLAKLCSRREPTLIYSLVQNVFDFVEENKGLKNCTLQNISYSNPLFQKVYNYCSNVIWLIGSNRCPANSTGGIWIQKIFGETYWDDKGFKRLTPNVTLNIGTAISPPFVNYSFVGSEKRYEGIAFALLQVVAEAAGFGINVIEDYSFGTGSNSSSDGLLGKIQQGEIDVIAGPMTCTEKRERLVDFSANYYFEEIGILIKQPKQKDDFWKMFSLFKMPVWLCIFAGTFTSIAVLYALHRFSATIIETSFMQLSHCSWYIFSSMLNQPEEMSPKTWSIQNFLSFFWLYAFAVLSVYSGGLIATLTYTKSVMPFINLTGLANALEDGTYKMCIQNNTGFSDIVMMRENIYKVLAEWLDRNPKYLANKAFCVQQMLTEENVAFLGEITTLQQLQVTNCNDTTKLILLPDRFYPGYFVFATQKKSPILSILSLNIMNFVEAGLITAWKNNFSAHQGYCELVAYDAAVDAQNSKLSILELVGPFLILGIGLCASIVAFIFEHFGGCHQKRKRKSLLKINPSANSLNSVSLSVSTNMTTAPSSSTVEGMYQEKTRHEVDENNFSGMNKTMNLL